MVSQQDGNVHVNVTAESVTGRMSRGSPFKQPDWLTSVDAHELAGV